MGLGISDRCVAGELSTETPNLYNIVFNFTLCRISCLILHCAGFEAFDQHKVLYVPERAFFLDFFLLLESWRFLRSTRSYFKNALNDLTIADLGGLWILLTLFGASI